MKRVEQAGGYCEEDQSSFSKAQSVHQGLDFSTHQGGRCSSALCTLTNEVDRRRQGAAACLDRLSSATCEAAC
jgi:hypothetical protein